MKYFILEIKDLIKKLYIFGYGLFHEIKPIILCNSYNGKQYADSAREITEYLHSINKDFEIVWTLNNDDDPYHVIPEYVKKVRYGSREYFNTFATCFCYITNNELRPWTYKRKGQFFIQTFHGDRGIKKVLYDSLKGKVNHYRRNSVRDSKYTDICLAGSDYGERVYRSAFHYQGRVLKMGTPRDDKLVNVSQETADIIKKTLGLQDDCKHLLYAPTFRDDSNGTSVEEIDLNELLIWLEKKTGNKWIALYRAHTLGIPTSNINDRIRDVSDYPDMSDLLLVADALITDYSSTAGDYCLLDRPLVLATFDIKDYIENSRELNYLPGDAGYDCASNMDELKSLLLKSIMNGHMHNRDKVFEFYKINETGESTKIVVMEILEKYKQFIN